MLDSKTGAQNCMLRWLWLALVVIVLDQATKVWAEASLSLYLPRELFTGLNFTLSYNTGAAFSFLAGAGGWQRWLFIALAVAVSAYIIHWLKKLSPAETMLAAALALILGGAIGNVIDRVYLGHVVDFIDVFYVADSCIPFFAQVRGSCHWPAFNIADMAISLGAVMLIIDSLRGRKKDQL